jgi:hypothetical protein
MKNGNGSSHFWQNSNNDLTVTLSNNRSWMFVQGDPDATNKWV